MLLIFAPYGVIQDVEVDAFEQGIDGQFIGLDYHGAVSSVHDLGDIVFGREVPIDPGE